MIKDVVELEGSLQSISVKAYLLYLNRFRSPETGLRYLSIVQDSEELGPDHQLISGSEVMLTTEEIKKGE